ncbi:MAG: FMN-binding protein [Akkermansiaceae bacterium]|nr:FMN-binding protein [Akkermansiaceae bacterium]NNM28376.1 FMN-binding protein [Akkermansiaceae bacterium]
MSLRAPHRLLPRIYRLAVLVAVVWLVHANHQWHRAQRTAVLEVPQVAPFFPGAAALGPREPPYHLQEVRDDAGRTIGLVLHTSPEADDIRGYSGPSDVLVAMDPTGTVIGAKILSSEDTSDHVDAVVKDKAFWAAFQGLALGAPGRPEVDAVSGSTLTSDAIVRSVVRRMGGVAESSLFPTPILLVEVQQLLPAAAALRPHPDWPGVEVVADAGGRTIAHALRTAPGQDALPGYQGPSDILILLDAEAATVAGLRLRKSYDNEEYYERILEHGTYLQLYNGWPVEEVAGADFKARGIEGVSGATLTSWSIAEGVKRRLRAFLAERDAPPLALPFTGRDAGLVLLTLGAVVMSFTSLRGHAAARMAWQAVLVVYLGFLAGDLLSQALLAGWAQNGIPWRNSPGLIILAAAAFVIPWTTGHQLYCHHLCPHGVLQRWMQMLPVRNRNLPGALHRAFSFLPAVLLAFVFAAVLFRLGVNLAALEPFDAYLFRIAGWASIGIAVAGLAASLFIPLAYCKYGCPTGLLLKFIRSRGAGERFERRDLIAAIFLATAAATHLATTT